MTDSQTIVDRAIRLIRTVTGDDYGDGITVTDVGTGISGGDPEQVWVTGDWNDHRTYNQKTGEWAIADDSASRLATALERIGVETWWDDQATACTECYQLIDAEVAFGTPPSIWVEDYGDVCVPCVEVDVNGYLDEFINDADKALPMQLDADVMTAAGWQQLPDDYRSGWYGREDRPEEVLASVLDRAGEGAEAVFQIESAHMFELSFVVWLRVPEA